jgi:SAM-dependent methyltransferase
VRPPSPAGIASEIHLVQGDVLHPPFEAEAFPAVLALSLLDTVPEPFVAFGQLDALLAPGGLLLVGTPYSWDPRVTDPRGWWSGPAEADPGTLRNLLAGRHPGLPHLRYEVLREERRVPWTVPGHDRLVYRYFLDLVLARKA